MWDLESVQTIVLALFGGAGATLFYELLVKPIRRHRHVADVVSAEIGLNMQVLAITLEVGDRALIPGGTKLSTAMFESLGADIGELPPVDVTRAIDLYRCFYVLDGLSRAFGELEAASDRFPLRSEAGAQHERRRQQLADQFYETADSAIDKANEVQPSLVKQAFPWWSLKKRPDTRELTQKQVRERVRDVDAARPSRRS